MDFKDIKILVCDDSMFARKKMGMFLSSLGIVNIAEAADGMLGLEQAHLEVPDLIISDVMMPNMNGLQFCQNIKNDLVLKLDLGFKKDITLLRRIDENNSQVSAGQNKINVYLTADYNFSQRLSAQAFFKYDMTIPEVANTFKNSTTYGGITLRFSLAQ